MAGTATPFARTLTLEELVMGSAEDEHQQDHDGEVKKEERKEEVEREGLRGGARVSKNDSGGEGLGSSAQGAKGKAGGEAGEAAYVDEGERGFLSVQEAVGGTGAVPHGTVRYGMVHNETAQCGIV